MPSNPRSIYQSNAASILYAGQYPHLYKNFDFKKAQQALQEKDHNGYYTCRAGIEWKQFDFKSGFDHLIKAGLRSIEGDWIYNAGHNWKRFNYQKALDALKQIGSDSNEHFRQHPPWLKWIREGGWPRGATETIEISKKMKASAEKMPKKPFGLKEEIGNPYLKMATYEIFNAGLPGNDPDFDFDLGLDALIKKRSASQISFAGTYWKEFDFARGLNALLKYDKRGEWIYNAGKYWKKFDYERGKAALKKIGEYGGWQSRRFLFKANSNWPRGVEEIKQQSQEMKQSAQKMSKKPFGLKEGMNTGDVNFDEYSANQIYLIGRNRPNDFDFEKGLDALIKKDTKGDWILRAGIFWKHFNYQKGINSLLEKPTLLHNAISWWPKGTDYIKSRSEDIKKKSKPMPKKSFGLKESVIRSIKCPECGKRMWEISSARGTKTGCTNPDCPEYHRPSDLVKEVRSAKLAYYGRKDK
jgi:hypothetical protein